MDIADLFVGTIAIAIGIMTFLSAVFNWEWAYQLGKARGVEARFGRRGARIFYGLLGVSLIALGSVIASGLGLYKSPPGRNNDDSDGKRIGLQIRLSLHSV